MIPLELLPFVTIAFTTLALITIEDTGARIISIAGLLFWSRVTWWQEKNKERYNK